MSSQNCHGWAPVQPIMQTKDVFLFYISGRACVEGADNVSKSDCTGTQLQNDLLSLHNTHLDGRHVDYAM